MISWPFFLCAIQPDGDAGDVVVVLQQTDHESIKRQELDLFVEKKISLQEALCGFKFVFEHLDGRKLCLSCGPGEVISPGVDVCCACINGSLYNSLTLSLSLSLRVLQRD